MIPNPRAKAAIRATLASHYPGLMEFPFAQLQGSKIRERPFSTVKHARENPEAALRILEEDAEERGKMEWASWEIARGCLDEASKNLMLSTLSYNTVFGDGLPENMRTIAPNWDLKYTSSNIAAGLYYGHFKSILGALYLGGVMAVDGVFIYRDLEAIGGWVAQNGSWSPPGRRRYLPQKAVIDEFATTRSRRLEWLPARSETLVGLKEHRERFTYKTTVMGTRDAGRGRDVYEEAFSDSLEFLEDVFGCLAEITPRPVDGLLYSAKWNPVARVNPLGRRVLELRAWAAQLRLVEEPSREISGYPVPGNFAPELVSRPVRPARE